MLKAEKHPNDDLDYVMEWHRWLAAGDIIETSTWSATGDLLAVDGGSDSDTTIVWLSGGTEGVTYTVTNSITTAQGRNKNMEVLIYVT